MVKTPSQSRQASEHDPENLPEVDGLESTPDNTDNSSSSSAPAAPQADRDRLKWQMQSQADTIKALQEQLQHATDALHNSHNTNDELHSPFKTTTPGIRETPGPHRLLPKGQRQEDKDFQDKVRHQSLLTLGCFSSNHLQRPFQRINIKISMTPLNANRVLQEYVNTIGHDHSRNPRRDEHRS